MTDLIDRPAAGSAPLPMDAPYPALDLPDPGLLDGASLFLDFDGTLVTLADAPDAVAVDAELVALLDRLGAALDGRLAILTGRDVGTLRGFLGGARLAVGGSHGAEVDWPDGRRTATPAPAWLGDAAEALHGFARVRPGVIVEVKPFGVGLHYRRVPDAETDARTFAEGLAATSGAHVQHGKMMVELRAPGSDKGDALRAFMAEPGWAGTRPVMLGDDLTDEAAFVAAAALGGAGILIGEPRRTAARHRLPDVPSTRAWLAAAAGGRA